MKSTAKMGDSTRMAKALIQVISDNKPPKEVYQTYWEFMNREISHDHNRRLFLDTFLNNYKDAFGDKLSRYDARLKYAKTIEAASNELEALSKKVGDYLSEKKTPKERTDPISNEFRKGLEDQARQNEPARKQFLSEAKEFLNKKIESGKPRSDYISGKGWPKVTFFRDPFRSSDIAESTRKDWLHKAIKEGNI